MPDLLLELFSEEIPAHMQQRAREELRTRITNALVEAGLVYEGAVAHVTPRRLCLHIAGLPARSKDVKEEKRGPRVGAPDAAIQGFLKGAELASLDQAQKVSDGKKGEYYVAAIDRPGRDTKEILSEIIVKTLREFPWPKSMRWGAQSASTSSLRWVRPLHSILCTFGSDIETPEVVEFDIDGIAASDLTYGHRFLSAQPIQARRFDDYVAKLEQCSVILDSERRKEIILADAKNLALAQNMELVEDAGLLEEVAGLVEWPTVLMGAFDKTFLDLPGPVIRTTIRNNQKCFVLRGQDGKLANKFILVANITASDGGKAIIKGNERVVAARLSDAKFFFEQDRKTKLLERAKKLDYITFHEKLGTQGVRVQRIAALAREIASLIGAKPQEAELAARLCKADLVTEMVGEFPELQGFMGRTYAKLEGYPDTVCAAIEEHYKPLGPSDAVPSNPVSIAVALADKFDSLTGFWAIGEKPTGSKDPFALRRTALGAFKIIINNRLRLRLFEILERPFDECPRSIVRLPDWKDREWKEAKAGYIHEKSEDLLIFFHDRLKVQLREQGLRHDVIDAVLALSNHDDLLMIVQRIEALDAFLKTENGAALQAGVTRALGILKIEEKKDKKEYDGKVDGKWLVAPEAKALAQAVEKAETAISSALKNEDFTAAMNAIVVLRAPIDTFFGKVTVNADDKILRENRLQLLARIRNAASQVADFSKLEG